MGWTDCWGMRASVIRFAAAALVAGVGFFASTASAATLIDFSGDKNANPYMQEGFAFDPARVVNGNCVAKGCLALNDNEATAMSYTGTPGLFTLSGLSFSLQGKGKNNSLTITGSNGNSLTLTVTDFAKKTYHTLVFGEEFVDVNTILFSHSGGGNVRIDDIAATAAPVPLPAAAWLLLAGISTLVVARRRGLSTA